MTDANGWTEVRNPGGPLGSTSFVNRVLGLVAIRGREMGRWHLSVSHRDRVPTWGELGRARDALLPPDAWLMIAHPPRKYWLNYDPRVLHMWEFRDYGLIRQFMVEGMEAQACGYGAPSDGGAP